MSVQANGKTEGRRLRGHRSGKTARRGVSAVVFCAAVVLGKTAYGADSGMIIEAVFLSSAFWAVLVAAVLAGAGAYYRLFLANRRLRRDLENSRPLQHTEEQFRLLFEAFNQGILVHRNYKPIYANQALADLHGYNTPDEVLALATTEVLAGPNPLAENTDQKKARGELISSEQDRVGIRRDGSKFWYRRRSFLIDWEGELAACSVRLDITRERETERALRESESRFRMLFETFNEGILIHQDHKPVFANNALAKIYGYETPEEMMALESVRCLVAPEFRNDMAHQARLSGEFSSSSGDVIGLCKDGSEKWMHRHSFSIMWNGSLATCSVRKDISGAKKAEERIRRGQKRFRDLIESFNQGILIHRRHKPLYANQALAVVYGYDSPQEILTLNSTYDLAHSTYRDTGGHEARLRGESVSPDGDMIGQRKNGEKIWVRRRSFAIDWEGEPAVCSVRVDITAEKESEERIQRSQKRFHDLIESFNQGILIHRHHKPLYANQAFAEMYRYDSPEEILALETTNILVDPEYAIEGHEKRLRGEDVPTDAEAMGIRKDGTKFWFRRRSFVIDWEGEAAVCSVRVDITAEKNATEALRQSEERFSTAVGNLEEGFALFDADDRLVLFNGAYQKMHGGVLGKLIIGMKWEELLRSRIMQGSNDDAVGREEEYIEDRIARHKNPRGPFVRRSSKTGTWSLVNETKLPDGGTVVVLTDISEIKKAEAEIVKKEQLFRSAIESLQEGLALYDADDRMVMYNEAYRQLHLHCLDVIRPGISFETMVRYNAENGFNKESHGRVEEYIQDRLNRHRTGSSEPIIRDGDGGPTRMIRESRMPDGGMVIVQSDITELKNQQQAILKSEERLRSIFENSKQGMIVHRRFQPLFVNQAFADLYGFESSDEIMALESIEHFTLEGGYSEGQHEQALIGERETKTRELRGVKKDGSFFWVEQTSFQIFLDDGPAICSIRTDVSERKKSQERILQYTSELERSNEELQQFANVASHDLQEPCRKVQTFSTRLLSKYGADLNDEARDYISRMVESGARMQTLIQDLLAYSKISNSDRPFTEVDLRQVVDDVQNDLEIAIKESGAKIVTESLPVIEADPLQMQQLFTNLIGNALKYRRDGVAPEIVITAAMSRDDAFQHDNGLSEICCIQIKDNGIGFQERYAKQIFTIFKRLHGRDKYQGTGIGLAVCQKIVQRHGGKIEAVGKPGVGSTFTVMLPTHHTILEATG